MTSRATSVASPPEVPADRRRPRASVLLDVRQAGALLAPLLPGVRIQRVRELSHLPGRGICVRYRADDGNGRTLVAVAHLDGHTLRAWIWPNDPALPVLAPGSPLLDAVGRFGVTDLAPGLERLGYRPLERATAGVGDIVLKAYATDAAFRRAADALATASRLPVPAATPIAVLPELRTTVQVRIAGERLGSAGATARAREVGAIAAALHDAAPATPHTVTTATILERCRPPARLVSTALPWLAPRIAACVARLGATAPPDARQVVSHGDLSADQLLATPGGLVVCDLDELALAAPAYDLATYAANVVSGRPDDPSRFAEAVDQLVAGYGRRPHELDWHLAAALLRRVDRPLRRGKRQWVERSALILSTAEEALS